MQGNNMRGWLALLLLIMSASVLAAPDYAREKNWADEITPTIIVGKPMYLEQANQHKFLGIYTEANKAKMGLVMVHGIGINPDWGMIGRLRKVLPDFGYTTLSIQMPVLALDARGEDYAELFPEAIERLQLAVAYLKSSGYKRIALVSHSLGSRMSHGYMVYNPAEISAWVALGTGTGPGPAITFDGIKAPVLDLYGANELPRVLEGAAKRKASLKGKALSKQVVIPDTDHFFDSREDEMSRVVRDFLDSIRK